jgi:hypothetical protein
VVPEGSEPIETLAADQIGAFCARAVRCREVATMNGCVKDALPMFPSRVVDDVHGGIISYDARLGFRCVQLMANWSCVEQPDRTSCHNAFKGTRPGGAPCFLNPECASGLCLMASGPAQCAPPGTCADGIETREVPPGGACAPGQCTEGNFCSMTGVCTPRVAEGGSCHLSRCGAGLVCLPLFDPEAICVRPAKTGESCATRPCEIAENTCDAANPICRDTLGIGTACGPGMDCGLIYVCLNGACVLPGELGQPCVGNPVDRSCQQVETWDTLTYLLKCDAAGLCTHGPDTNGLACLSP